MFVKIIVAKVVINVLLKWSRIILKLVVTFDGELCGNQYVSILFNLSSSPHNNHFIYTHIYPMPIFIEKALERVHITQVHLCLFNIVT